MISKSQGLSLISTYSDEDDDELLQHSAESANEVHSTPRRNGNIHSKTCGTSATEKLPLPNIVTGLFKTGQEDGDVPLDNPDQHDGRIRSFAHERGNWSTFVYIPYNPEHRFIDLVDRLEHCALELGFEMKIISASDLHVSVTRTVVLMHHWIDGFVSSIRSKISHIPRFCIQFGQPAVYCNDEKTRTFLGLGVITGSKQLQETSKALDSSLREFRLPPFYEEASFHMSVLWALGDVRQALRTVLPQFNALIQAFVAEHSEVLYMDVRQCLCKTGNKLFSFDFSD